MLKNSSRGVTIVEVVIATAMLVAVALSISLFAPQAIQALTKLHTRSVAASLASAKMEEIKSHPYGAIPVTPDGPATNDYFSVVSTTGPCDCSNVNFNMPLKASNAVIALDTVTIGGIVYTRQSCVNYMQSVTGLGWQSNCSSDTGLKQIVTNITWVIGTDTQTFTMRNLASPPSVLQPIITSTGSVTIVVCPALNNGAIPPDTCDNANLAAVQTAEVAVYNNTFMAENAHVVPPGNNTVLLQVPPGTYDLHVQMPGYFPFHQTGITITPGLALPPITAYLRDTGTYGSNYAGEVFISTHPTISKVIAGVGARSGSCSTANPVCNDRSEALEIYNGTSQTLKFGCGSGANCLQVAYCTGLGGSIGNGVGAGPVCSVPWDGTLNPPFNPNLVAPASILPGAFYLIAGIDYTQHACTSSGTCPWGVVPDLKYDASNKLIQGNSNLDSGGGGIKLYMSGILVDTVRWQDVGAHYPTTGLWLDAASSVLPAGSVAPVACQ